MRFKKTLIGACALAAITLAATACGSDKTTVEDVTTSTSTSITSTTSSVGGTTSSAPTATTTSTYFDKDADYREIASTLKLSGYGTDKTFFNDGIEAARLAVATDGDTATFTLNSGSSVTIRFQDIDTPESTGTVEKWGKSASKYTAKRLNNATSIVLEAIPDSSTGLPYSKDSYGSRYMGYVWYKDANTEDYINLNLEVVENGYSTSHALPTSKYYSYFTAAQSFAKSHQMHVHGNDEDPNFSDAVNVTTIGEINADLAKSNPTFYDKTEGVGQNVAFEAYILDVVTSSSGTYTYTAAEYDSASGKVNTITLYGGYSSDNINSIMRIGQYYHIKGSIQKHSGNWQIAIGGSYVFGETGAEFTYLMDADYYFVFNSTTISGFNAGNKKKQTNVFNDFECTSATFENNTLTLVGSATNSKGTKQFTIKVNNITNQTIDPQTYIGKSISVKGGYKTNSTSDSIELKVLYLTYLTITK